jgi:hypothetical protein
MTGTVRRAVAAGAGALTLMALGAGTALAADDGSQLVDVSKQVAGIEKKLDDLRSHGRWAMGGRLLASADCGYADEASPVFARWGDDADYFLAPQGDLASTGGWTLGKATSVVSDGDPYSGAERSLQLGNGADAATPAICVDLDKPTFRFFVRDVGGNGKALLKVDVLYEDLTGHMKRMTVARVRAGEDWQPSIVVPMYMNMLAAASPQGVTAVAFAFKAEGLQKDEAVSVSSIYVDPFSSRR